MRSDRHGSKRTVRATASGAVALGLLIGSLAACTGDSGSSAGGITDAVNTNTNNTTNNTSNDNSTNNTNSSNAVLTDDAQSSSSNGTAVDNILKGRGSERFSFAPEFLNGATGETLETIWKCAVLTDDEPLLLFLGFAANFEAVADFADGKTIGTWNRTGDTLRMEFNGKFRNRTDFADMKFVSDVSFEFNARSITQLGVVAMDETFPETVKPRIGACRLNDANSYTNLDSAPYQTSEGPASYDRPEPVALTRIPDIVNMTEVARLTGDPNRLYSFSTRVVLSDGTYTSNTKHLETHGIAVSRILKPGYWGKWTTLPSGSIGFRKDTSADFVVPDIATVYTRPTDGLSLNKCYQKWDNTIIGGIDGIVSIRSSRYCFGNNGVFSHGNSVSTTTPNVVAGSGSKTEGLYDIQGFSIKLTYGNGATVTKLFAGSERGVVVGGLSFF